MTTYLARLCALAILCILPAQAGDLRPTLYSPAPEKSSLHALNGHLATALATCPDVPPVQLPAVPLPTSINRIGELPAPERALHLPIVTTVDLIPAREGIGAPWHDYTRANPDLLFLSTLYDVGFGILAFNPDIKTPEDLIGRRIGVPANPSSVRLLTEALLRDGWGILDRVTLVELSPPEILSAARSGRIDATSWNLMARTRDGFRPLLPPLPEDLATHWLSVDTATLAAFNAAQPFNLTLTEIAPATRLLSFKQGLAGWADTPDTLVTSLLACLAKTAGTADGLPASSAAMTDWPDLSETLLHPAAQAFYKAH